MSSLTLNACTPNFNLSKRLVEIAELTDSDAIAHGATGKGNHTDDSEARQVVVRGWTRLKAPKDRRGSSVQKGLGGTRSDA